MWCVTLFFPLILFIWIWFHFSKKKKKKIYDDQVTVLFVKCISYLLPYTKGGVYVASTIRNENTYYHFLSLLGNFSSILSFVTHTYFNLIIKFYPEQQNINYEKLSLKFDTLFLKDKGSQIEIVHLTVK